MPTTHSSRLGTRKPKLSKSASEMSTNYSCESAGTTVYWKVQHRSIFQGLAEHEVPHTTVRVRGGMLGGRQ
jgi:hypothetical protein